MLTGRWRLILGVLLLFLLAGLFFLYSSMSHLTRELAEKRVPGLTFSDLEIGWNLLTIRGIRYVDPETDRLLLSADQVVISPSFTSFFSDEIQVSSIDIVTPYVYVLRDSEGRLHLPLPRREPSTADTGGNPGEEPSSLRVAINEISGATGSGEFIDQTVVGPDAHYRLSNLNFSVRDLRYPPQNRPVQFEVSSFIEGETTSQLQISGWYDFVASSADLAVHLQDFTFNQGEPYLRERIRVEELGEGRIDADADLKMTEGQYTVTGHLTLTDFVVSQLQERLLGFPTEILQVFLRDTGGEVIVPFDFKGRLGEGGEPFDPGALLMNRLEEELGSNAALLDLLKERDSEKVREKLEELKKKGERLRDLFR